MEPLKHQLRCKYLLFLFIYINIYILNVPYRTVLYIWKVNVYRDGSKWWLRRLHGSKSEKYHEHTTNPWKLRSHFEFHDGSRMAPCLRGRSQDRIRVGVNEILRCLMPCSTGGHRIDSERVQRIKQTINNHYFSYTGAIPSHPERFRSHPEPLQTAINQYRLIAWLHGRTN